MLINNSMYLHNYLKASIKLDCDQNQLQLKPFAQFWISLKIGSTFLQLEILKMMSSKTALLWSFLALVLCISHVMSFCCKASGDIGKCGDGTEPTPCCATQRCNILCCNCDGICRGSSRFAPIPDVN
ncbi:unnamed protein product, partial [Allacma fusca]